MIIIGKNAYVYIITCSLMGNAYAADHGKNPTSFGDNVLNRINAHSFIDTELDKQRDHRDDLITKFTNTALQYYYFNKNKTASEIALQLHQLKNQIQETEYQQDFLAKAQYDLYRGIDTEEAYKPVQQQYNKPYIKTQQNISVEEVERDLIFNNSVVILNKYLPKQPFFKRIRDRYRAFVIRVQKPAEDARLQGQKIPYRRGWRRLIPSFFPLWKSPEQKTLDRKLMWKTATKKLKKEDSFGDT